MVGHVICEVNRVPVDSKDSIVDELDRVALGDAVLFSMQPQYPDLLLPAPKSPSKPPALRLLPAETIEKKEERRRLIDEARSELARVKLSQQERVLKTAEALEQEAPAELRRGEAWASGEGETAAATMEADGAQALDDGGEEVQQQEQPLSGGGEGTETERQRDSETGQSAGEADDDVQQDTEAERLGDRGRHGAIEKEQSAGDGGEAVEQWPGPVAKPTAELPADDTAVADLGWSGEPVDPGVTPRHRPDE